MGERGEGEGGRNECFCEVQGAVKYKDSIESVVYLDELWVFWCG